MNPWTLPRAFACTDRALIAITGGGGKTSLMFALAAELPPPLVTTTTTRIFAAQIGLAEHSLSCGAGTTPAQFRPRLEEALRRHQRCLVIGDIAGEKATGVSPELVDTIWQQLPVTAVLVEADGSRMRPVKAPAAHEPVIPAQSSHVIPVMGIDALAQPLGMAAHRPELVAALLGIETPFGGREHQLTAEDAAVLLAHPQGGAKGAPPAARLIPFINKVESRIERQLADQIATQLLQAARVSRVVIGRMQPEPQIAAVWRRVTAVILAAGQSSRMGTLKQLLPWGETTVLGQTVRNVRSTSVTDMLVVTGHQAEEVAAAAHASGAATVLNPDYAAGEMLSSLQTAVRALPPGVEAVLVVLADQPMVPAGVMERLLRAYREQDAGLVAPVIDGRRGNPVLIDRRFFAPLLALPADAAPRHLLRRYADQLLLVPVESNAVLRDLDSPDAYASELAAWRQAGHETDTN